MDSTEYKLPSCGPFFLTERLLHVQERRRGEGKREMAQSNSSLENLAADSPLQVCASQLNVVGNKRAVICWNYGIYGQVSPMGFCYLFLKWCQTIP